MLNKNISQGPSPLCLWDILFVALAAFYAYAVAVGVVDMSAGGAVIDSDLDTYAQGMIGAMHPGLFAADPVLHAITPANSIWNVQRWLAECITTPDAPAVALLRAGALGIFVWFTSFYVLGRWLFGRPALAALTSLLMGITVYMEWGTFWGVLQADPVPRVLYGALWPFLLMGCVAAVKNAWLRPLVMLATGASIWVHGVNALNCGAMFFLAFFFHKPKGCSWLGHLGLCALCLVLFFGPVLAFLWPSLAPRAFSADELAIFRGVFALRWQHDYGHLAERLWHLLSPTHELSILWLLGLGLAGGLVVILRGRDDGRSGDVSRIRQLAGLYPYFVLALLLVVGFSAAEGAWSQATGRLPLGHELVRGLRYLIPFSWLMFVGAVATFATSDERSSGAFSRRLLPALVVALAVVLFCVVQDRQNVAAHHGISMLTGVSLPLEAQAQEAREDAAAFREALDAVASTVPVGESVFADGEYMAVRHVAKRPLVHTFKDGYAHYYSRDPEGCRVWLGLTRRMDKARKEDPVEIVAIWLDSGAPWLLFRNAALADVVKASGGSIAWQGKGWFLARAMRSLSVKLTSFANG